MLPHDAIVLLVAHGASARTSVLCFRTCASNRLRARKLAYLAETPFEGKLCTVGVRALGHSD